MLFCPSCSGEGAIILIGPVYTKRQYPLDASAVPWKFIYGIIPNLYFTNRFSLANLNSSKWDAQAGRANPQRDTMDYLNLKTASIAVQKPEKTNRVCWRF
jgi:hypothetical protein